MTFPGLMTQAGLPSASSTHSYWHSEPSRKLKGHQTTPQLPRDADVVVIGSGMTGTFAARELVARGRRVLMLEAREACWDATGRNGGHCHPGVWNTDPEMARFELATFALIRDLVTEHEIPCGWRVTGAVQPILRPEVVDAARKRLCHLQQHHPDLRDKAVFVNDGTDLAARSVTGAVAAVHHPNAAQLWPYKLVAWLLEKLLREHDASVFSLHTNTPVLRLLRNEASAAWIVNTVRGSVQARDVLLATNAYTSRLLPGMAGLVVPVRGQVCAFEPPPGQTAQLPHGYVWIKDSDQGYLMHHYLIQRPSESLHRASHDSPGPLIFGGDVASPTGGEGMSNDDELDPALSELLRRGLREAIQIPGTANEAPERDSHTVFHEWTGIMGYSRDANPWVGPVPTKLQHGLGNNNNNDDDDEADADDDDNDVDNDMSHRGLWLCAGYTGHGMPVAAQCGIVVARMMTGEDPAATPLPRSWLMSHKRADKARSQDMPRTVCDIVEQLMTADEARRDEAASTQMG